MDWDKLKFYTSELLMIFLRLNICVAIVSLPAEPLLRSSQRVHKYSKVCSVFAIQDKGQQ
jgi:hypothetical protein